MATSSLASRLTMPLRGANPAAVAADPHRSRHAPKPPSRSNDDARFRADRPSATRHRHREGRSIGVSRGFDNENRRVINAWFDSDHSRYSKRSFKKYRGSAREIRSCLNRLRNPYSNGEVQRFGEYRPERTNSGSPPGAAVQRFPGEGPCLLGIFMP